MPMPKIKNPKLQRYYARKTGKCPVCGSKLKVIYDYDEEDAFTVRWLICPNCNFRCIKDVKP